MFKLLTINVKNQDKKEGCFFILFSSFRTSFWEMFLKIEVLLKIAKYLKKACKRIHFLVKMQAVGLQLH